MAAAEAPAVVAEAAVLEGFLSYNPEQSEEGGW
jgi:hypothetical protein